MSALPTIALTIGDPAGIGPEIVLKALADTELAPLAHWVVVGDASLFEMMGCQPDNLHDAHFLDGPVAIGELDAHCGAAGVEYVRIATEMCLRGEADAMVTAPLNKEAVTLSGRPFSGHTEYIAELCGATESRMLLASERLSTVHVTTHVALRAACSLSTERIVRTIELGHEAMQLLGFDRPRIAVCGLNPHAGEHGLFGDEDARFIVPAVAAGRAEGIDCTGPHAGDTVFLQASRGAYDLVVAMYHDQGHIPMKLLDFEGTVNISLGIPIIRTSVDHGTAFDIAGKNMADPRSMKQAMRLAARMAAWQEARREMINAAVIVAYMAALLLLGLRFSRRQTSTERYFVAKRSIPGWATGMSLLATLISSVTFIAYPGSAYAGDWSNLVPGLMVVPVLALVAAVVIPFFRQTVRTSAYEYFGRRFGYPARVYGSIAYALGHFSKMGFVFYLLALTVSSMTGWKTESVIILVGIVTVAYTLAGGIEAVIWADVIQGFALWLGIVICVAYLLFLPPGGPGAVLSHAWESGKISLGSRAPDFSKPTVLVLALYGFFYYLQRYTADQTVVQRYLVAQSDRAALRGIALGSLLCIPVWTLFMLIGTLCWEFYRAAPPALKADQAFPYFITTHVPPGLAGLFLAALFGAAMANLSSDFNSLAAIAVEDYYRMMRPASTEARRLVVAKIVVAVCGLLCVVIATVLAHTNGTALGLWYTVSAIVAGGLAGLFLLAFLVARAGATAAYLGIGASLLFTAWATLTLDGGKLWDLGRFNFPLHNYMIGVIGHVVLLGIGCVACFFFPNRNLAAREMTLWGWLRQNSVNACLPVESSLP